MDSQIIFNDFTNLNDTALKLRQNLDKIEKDLSDEKNLFEDFEKSFQTFENLAIQQSQNSCTKETQSSQNQQTQLQDEIDILQAQCKELVLQNQEDQKKFLIQIKKFKQNRLDQKQQLEQMQLNFSSTEQRLTQKLEIQEQLINQLKIQRQTPQDQVQYINELEQQNINLKLNVSNIKSSMEKYQQQQIIDESYFNKERDMFKKELQNLEQQQEDKERELQQELTSMTNQRDNIQKILQKKQKQIDFLKEDDEQNIKALQTVNEKFTNFRNKSNQNIAYLNTQIGQLQLVIQSQEFQIQNYQQQINEQKILQNQFQSEIKLIQEACNQRIDDIRSSSSKTLEELEKSDQLHMEQFKEFQSNQDMVINQMSQEMEQLRKVQQYWNQYIPEYAVELRKNKQSGDLKLRVYIFTNGDVDDNDAIIYLNEGIYYLQFSGNRKLNTLNAGPQNIIMDGRKQGDFRMNALLFSEVDIEKNEKIIFKNLSPFKIKTTNQYIIVKFDIYKEQLNTKQLEIAKQRLQNIQKNDSLSSEFKTNLDIHVQKVEVKSFDPNNQNSQIVKIEKSREIDLPLQLQTIKNNQTYTQIDNTNQTFINDPKNDEKSIQLPLQYEHKQKFTPKIDETLSLEKIEKVDNTITLESISDALNMTATKSEDIKYKSIDKKYISDQGAVEETSNEYIEYEPKEDQKYKLFEKKYISDQRSVEETSNEYIEQKFRTSFDTQQLISASQYNQQESDQDISVISPIKTQKLETNNNTKISQSGDIQITNTVITPSKTEKLETKNNSKTYINGDIYSGPLNNNKRDGFGQMQYSNGNIYVGNWKNDYKDGKGQMQYSNGETYEGDWKYDQKHGQGIFQFANGDVFEGQFKYNQKTQNGKLTQKNLI